MNKELIISTCSGCCYYDNQYWSYSDECSLLEDTNERGHKSNRVCHGKIQPDCPLEDSDKITTEERLGKAV